eukprot:220449-Chlamydomonas_euryale.AAC.2
MTNAPQPQPARRPPLRTVPTAAAADVPERWPAPLRASCAGCVGRTRTGRRTCIWEHGEPEVWQPRAATAYRLEACRPCKHDTSNRPSWTPSDPSRRLGRQSLRSSEEGCAWRRGRREARCG